MPLADLFRSKPISTLTNSAPAHIAISEKLEAARQALGAIEIEHDGLALNVALGGEGADVALEDWRQRRFSALALVADLEAASRGAIAADQAREAKRAVEQRRQVIADVKGDLTEQLRAFTKLAAAIENLSDAWCGAVELSKVIHDKLAKAGMPPSDLMPWCALVRPDRLRQLVSIELWRTNKTKRSNEGTFRHGMFGVQEAERHRNQLAVEGYADLASGNPADATPMRARLMAQREELLRIVESQPVPRREIVVEPVKPRALPRVEGMASVPQGLPFNADVLPPPIPMSVVLPEDAREADLLARIAKRREETPEQQRERMDAELVKQHPQHAQRVGVTAER